MPRNDAAATGHVCPGIRIHAIDIVQPPGIGISPIADMEAHQTMVTAALAAKSSAETPKKARPTTSLSPSCTRRGGATRRPSRYAPWGRGRATGTCPRGRPVRAHRWNRLVDDAALERERAQARPLARVRGHVGSGHGRERSGPVGCRARGYLGPLAAAYRLRRLAPVVVFDAPL